MSPDIRYDVFDPEGIPFGYIVDCRLYEFRTGTCVGSVENGELTFEGRVEGRIENMCLIKNDGTRFEFKPTQQLP